MDLSEGLLRKIFGWLTTRDCLRSEIALRRKLYTKDEYLKRAEMDPVKNVIRFFKKGQFVTYNVYSYINSEGNTYSDVTISPLCNTLACRHIRRVTPSEASQWVVSVITSNGHNGFGLLV